MKTKTLHNVQLFWSFFVGLGAYVGAFMMFYDTSGEAFGMKGMLPFFQKLPFADKLFNNFLVPGIALLIINGLTNTMATVMLLKRKKYDAVAGMVCGIVLMLWISIQFYIFPFNFMSTIYFVFGILQTINGILLIYKTNKY